MPHPLLNFGQSDSLIQIIDINSYTECKHCRSRSFGFFRSQLIWICTVCKGRVYPGSAGQVLNIMLILNKTFSKVLVWNICHITQPLLATTISDQSYMTVTKGHILYLKAMVKFCCELFLFRNWRGIVDYQKEEQSSTMQVMMMFNGRL